MFLYADLPMPFDLSLRLEPGHELLSLLLPLALLSAHPFQLFKNLACVLFLSP